MLAGPRRRFVPGKLATTSCILAIVATLHLYRLRVHAPIYSATSKLRRNINMTRRLTANHSRLDMRRPPTTPVLPTKTTTTSHSIRVFMQYSKNGWRSLGEVIRIHRPLALSPVTRRFDKTSKRDMLCTDFSGGYIVNNTECETLLSKQNWEKTGASVDNVLAHTKIVPPQRCTPGTTVIVSLSWRDYNVCHIMMKLLFTHTITQRVRYTSRWLHIPLVKRVVILGGNDRNLRFFGTNPERFHAGFARALFTKHGIEFIAVRSLDELAKTHPCYAAAVFVGSHANRFAFPDTVLGENAGYDRTELNTNMLSRQHPISSDALALRTHIFGAQPKKMRFKLVYIYRGGPARRRWSKKGELKMNRLLRTVTRELGAEYVVFKPKRGDNFRSQVAQFEDACVIVGIHGAGLALSVFAPHSAALVEIEPEYHLLSLFGNVRSSGLAYDMIQLSKGSTSESMFTSNLIPKDERRIATLLRTRLLERKGIARAK